MSEDKRKLFGKEFVILGATIDFSSTHQGVIELKNKPARVEEIRELAEDI